MSKDDRSSLNPFTGKKHYDSVNDDEFLQQSYNAYYNEVNNYQIMDNTEIGQQVIKVSSDLIIAIENYLQRIGRYDYVDGYYDWEVHLLYTNIENACCFPGGKIIVYRGILDVMESVDELAFVLGHEISHALLDHSRTQASVNKTKNTVAQASWIGSLALDMMGMHGAGDLARAAVNVADMGSDFFLTRPWGRDQELEADKLGLIFTYMAGYNVENIPAFWQRFSNNNSNSSDFLSSHPSDEKRIAVMRESLYEIYNSNDFYSRPLLPETPKAKKHFNENNNATNYQIRSNNHYCTQCGNPVKEGDNFCINCGSKL